MSMTTSRPYLVRALYDWIIDNDCTPFVLVDASADNVEVPQQYVKNGQIVLNISPVAVMGLDLGNQAVSFNGRFGGQPMDVFVPIEAVMGIYARENGQGMVFEMQEPEPPAPDDDPTGEGSGGDKPEKTSTKNKPGLRVVK